MAQETGSEPAIEHNRSASHRIAARPGERLRDRVADDPVGLQRLVVGSLGKLAPHEQRGCGGGDDCISKRSAP
jgi:hypothetical protein